MERIQKNINTRWEGNWVGFVVILLHNPSKHIFVEVIM